MTKSKFLSCAIALALSTIAGRADLVLVIDLSDISAVKVTAVGNNSLSDDTTTTGFDGITLWQFFSGAADISSTMSGDLQTSGSGILYDNFLADNYSTGSSNLDLNFYSGSSANAQDFSTTEPPFIGMGIFDLSSLNPSILPSIGTTGAVYSGYSGAPGQQLGEYSVVPEPSTFACVSLALAACFVFFRKPRAA